MNTGTPTHATDDEKDQVKLNQQTSGAEPPNLASQPRSPAVPPMPPGPTVWPPPSDTPPSPKPMPALPPVEQPSTPPPTPAKEETEIGVGKPNIGVELEEEKPATISVSRTTTDIPATPKAVPPQTPPPAPTKPAPLAPAQPQTGKIEVQVSDIPIKTYDQSKTTDQPTPPAKPAIPVSPMISTTPTTPGATPATPPVKVSTGSPAVMITVLAILALVLGGAGGFFGFRTWDRLKTLASVEKSPEATLTATASEEPSLDVSRWQTYTSTLYNFSLKYPNGWIASTTDPTAETIVFAANNESLAGDPSSFRIEIDFQDANGKTLKSWVEANSIASNEKKAAKEITVDGQTAYQQELVNLRPAVATFIARNEKIMIVTFTAPPDKLAAGGDWYNNLINSLKLM